MPSEVQNAWVAGLIDGDGCITLANSGAGNGRRKPYVVVDSTDPEILEELLRLFGGGLVKKHKAREHHRQAWSWRLYGADIILAFLGQVRPYMRCGAKCRRADLLLSQYKILTPRNGQYTADLLARRLAFEQQFMAICAGRGSQGRPRTSGD